MLAPRLPAATRVAEVCLNVRDLDRVTSFYAETLGLDLVQDEGRQVVLGAGKAGFLRLEDGRNTAGKGLTTGLFHLAILYPSRDDLASALRRLTRKGSALQGAADHLVSEAIYLSDPEENGVELYRDRPRADWPRAGDGVRMATLPLDLGALLRETVERPSWSAPPGTTVGHVHLQVHDLETVERFYTDAMGFDLMQRYGHQASFLSAGGYHHHVGINTWATRGAPPPPPDAPGLRWFRIEVPDDAALEALAARLDASGYPPRKTRGGLLVTDPAGLAVRVTPAPPGAAS